MSTETWNSHQRKAKTGHCRYWTFSLGEALALICFSFEASEPAFESEGHTNTVTWSLFAFCSSHKI